MNDTPKTERGEEPLEIGYLRRVYQTTMVVWAVLGLLAFAHGGLRSALGFSLGVAITLGSLQTIEWTVRFLFHPGMELTPGKIALLLNLKLPMLTLVLAGAVWAAVSGAASLLALVGGITLVPAVIVLKAVGAWLVSVMPSAPSRARGARPVVVAFQTPQRPVAPRSAEPALASD